ncbi:Amino acid transporter, transmembrane domain [Dillenia turbinata]|uniref:Amino acid transporter, transmembrane domain n=1 Tax=Dillenia turbinata TaxID=194707 RepID=A0AAN8V048_9MAGN
MAEQMELPPFKSKGTSFLKTCFNGLNALSGIGIITIPYTLSQSGWLSLGLLVAMAIVTCFTGLLLQKCMDSNPSIKTYSDIGSCSFGHKGRIIVSIFMYLEVYLVPTGFLILEGDNLHKLFPNVSVEIGGHNIGGRQFFTVLAGLVILPSMWLKDLSMLSLVSASGVLSSVVVIASILWVAVFDGVGFSGHGEVFNLGGVPTSLSLYAFCYGAHPVFPTLYTSIKDKSQFSKVMLFSFGLSTLSYVSMAIIGYAMFGNNVQSQVTLNLPTNKPSSKIAIYTTLVGPVAKYALIITPLANAIESCLPSHYNNRPICILLRTLLLISTVFIALVFPFFGYLMALVGAILNVSVSIVLPCICYLKIFEVYKRWGFELVFIGGIIVMAFLVGVLGTYSSVKGIVTHF